MNIKDILVGYVAYTMNGTEFTVKAIDQEDNTVMDEYGTWHYFDDCDFPSF